MKSAPQSPAQRLRLLITTLACTIVPLVSLQANTLEEAVAQTFSKKYHQNQRQLQALRTELNSLPQPYMREPTGTGGFLSHEQAASTNEIVLQFTWPTPVKLDAIAFFPLRLFMDEIYADNLYWPGSIKIQAEIGGTLQDLAQGGGGAPRIRQSLPQLITFAPVRTQHLSIHCTDLPQHPYQKWYAAGFAEICIFSGAANVAPRATCHANSSRQGFHVLAKEFLTDAQTPLGIPEINRSSSPHAFIKKIGWGKKALPKPYILTCIYPREIPIDAIRIDPAIEHSYGQSFPVRFSIDLLNAEGDMVQSDHTYQDFPLRPPGLNPVFSYFPKTMAKAVRLTIHEASQLDPQATPAIAFSEITALYKGKESARAIQFEEKFRAKRVKTTSSGPFNTKVKQTLPAANDGLTHTGELLHLRPWIEGLVRRQHLLEEQQCLQDSQQKIVNQAKYTLLYGSLGLLLLAPSVATYFIARNRIRMRKQLRLTRAQIASDLHDDVGSNLGAIILHTEKLKDQLSTPQEIKRLHSIYRLTRESVFGLREVLSTSAPEVGRTQNIITYMEELADLILGKTAFSFTASPAMSEELLKHQLRKGILLFYKEALYNAKQHAHCKAVTISLQSTASTIVLQIKDDGCGIDTEHLKKPRTLRTLKHRAEWLQAALTIHSKPEQGTELTLTIPKRKTAV